jgi:hypothetical protein
LQVVEEGEDEPVWAKIEVAADRESAVIERDDDGR